MAAKTRRERKRKGEDGVIGVDAKGRWLRAFSSGNPCAVSRKRIAEAPMKFSTFLMLLVVGAAVMIIKSNPSKNLLPFLSREGGGPQQAVTLTTKTASEQEFESVRHGGFSGVARAAAQAPRRARPGRAGFRRATVPRSDHMNSIRKLRDIHVSFMQDDQITAVRPRGWKEWPLTRLRVPNPLGGPTSAQSTSSRLLIPHRSAWRPSP